MLVTQLQIAEGPEAAAGEWAFTDRRGATQTCLVLGAGVTSAANNGATDSLYALRQCGHTSSEHTSS